MGSTDHSANGSVPGSPSATASIDGKYLPPPSAPFGGEINLTAQESKPFWPAKVVPPKGAPNVLLIMTDDQGYGVCGTFGGVIPTPALDRVAKAGLRYTQFHSTALCSPSRAALITGRNHHSVGFGVITEQSTGYPGYDSIIGPENATVGAILKHNGYATSWFGKEHNTPSFQYSVAGPFEQWPVGMGFEYFYGFMGGETDQWQPYLFQNQTQIFPGSAGRTTTLPPIWPTRRSTIYISWMHPLPKNRFSSTTCPAERTPHINQSRNGSKSSRASSTWVGTRCASSIRKPKAPRRNPAGNRAYSLARKSCQPGVRYPQTKEALCAPS